MRRGAQCAGQNGGGPRRGGGTASGMTLVELLVVISVIAVMAGALVPTVKFAVKRQKEVELRRALRTVRTAIDQYKKFCDTGVILKEGVDSECYPPDLETLVKGAENQRALGQKLKFLRRVPLDPMTASYDWGLRSYQDEPDASTWGHENVYDVFTTSGAKGLDGTKYKDW
ncbi:MAG TPA: type II secretion system protein [Candidatus Polarisedimenticolia bacterium]|nr:type II secretion system protein [Candidatus Polarisedimenticolia bacterium]